MTDMAQDPSDWQGGQSRAERRLGARLLTVLCTAGNPDHGRAGSGEVVFLCIASAWRERPHLPPTVRGVQAGDLADDNASFQRMRMHAGA
jgi:hypothetical protein